MAKWTEEEKALLRRVYPLQGVEGVMKLLPHRPYSGIKTKASELGVKRTHDAYGFNIEERDKYILSSLRTMSVVQIATKLNVPVDFVYSICKSRGYNALDNKKQRYIEGKGINTNFFKTWSREMAWVLGLLTSDGNIMDNGGIRLTLKSDDRDCVEKVRNLLAPNQEIVIDKGLNEYARFNITSLEMKSDLEKLGVTPRKSLVIKPPSVPGVFISDYIRGLIDGDGSVLYVDTPGLALRVCVNGNPYIVDYVNQLLQRLTGVSLRVRQDRLRDNRVSVSSIEYSTLEAIRVCDFLYSTSTADTRLSRKYNNYTRYMEQKVEGRSWTDAENSIIINKSPDVTLKSLLKFLPNRTYDALKVHTRVLRSRGLLKW